MDTTGTYQLLDQVSLDIVGGACLHAAARAPRPGDGDRASQAVTLDLTPWGCEAATPGASDGAAKAG
jgi:hypothetical protein